VDVLVEFHGSSECHFYDDELADSLDALTVALSRATGHTDLFHNPSGDGNHYRLMGRIPGVPRATFDSMVNSFLNDVAETKTHYLRFINLIRQRFPGLSLQTLDTKARRLHARITAPKVTPESRTSTPISTKKSSMSRPDQLRQRATIGILTALPKELAAVRVMLENPVRWTAQTQGTGTRYFLGEVPSLEGGAHVAAVALLPDMGNNSAALSAQALLTHFPSVQHLIMCGIAGGVPRTDDTEHDVRLGDIVVSNRNGVVQYDLVKLTEGQQPEHRHPPRPPGRELLDAVRHLEAEALLGEQPWEAFLERGAKVKKSGRPADNLDARGEPISYPDDSEREEGLPRVFSGTVAASNALLKVPEIRDRLGRRFGVKAIDMEDSGVADASWFSDRAGYLVVRGICDYCDGKKGDAWQGYAAVAAAAYVRALLESMAVAQVTGQATEAPADSSSSGDVSVSGSGHTVVVGSPGATVGGQVNVSDDATSNIGGLPPKQS